MKKEEAKRTLFQIPAMGLPLVPHDTILGDPLGSYTGRPWNKDGIPEEMLEVPVQDADDL